MPVLSHTHGHLGRPDRNGDYESGLEAIVEDATTGDIYLVRETVDISGPAPAPLDSAAADAPADAAVASVRGGKRLLGLDAATDHPSWHAVVIKADLTDSDYAIAVIFRALEPTATLPSSLIAHAHAHIKHSRTRHPNACPP